VPALNHPGSVSSHRTNYQVRKVICAHLEFIYKLESTHTHKQHHLRIMMINRNEGGFISKTTDKLNLLQ